MTGSRFIVERRFFGFNFYFVFLFFYDIRISQRIESTFAQNNNEMSKILANIIRKKGFKQRAIQLKKIQIHLTTFLCTEKEIFHAQVRCKTITRKFAVKQWTGKSRTEAQATPLSLIQRKFEIRQPARQNQKSPPILSWDSLPQVFSDYTTRLDIMLIFATTVLVRWADFCRRKIEFDNEFCSREIINHSKPIAYTIVMFLVKVLHNKGP